VTARPCPDCAAPTGTPHADGCDVARCLHSGGQRLMCQMLGGTPVIQEIDGEPTIGAIHDGHDCGADVWTGRWPGEAECEEFGWWSVFYGFDKIGGTGWLRCGPDTPEAVPDLTRLHTEGEWDREAQRWRRRSDRVDLEGAR